MAKAGQPSQSYVYDDQGRRIQKTVGTATTNYLYSGSDLIAEYGAAWGLPTAQYLPGPDAPVERMTATGAQYYHADGLNSIVAATDQTGATAGTQRFDAWGNVLASTGSIPHYGYTGREPDETGLVYYRARYYDPSIGRFTQRDPSGLRGGINLYAYVGNNPVNLTDPSGLLPKTLFADAGCTYAICNLSDVTNALSSGVQSLGNSLRQNWEASPANTLGKDLGGLAAYAQGVATGDTHLASAAAEGLAAAHQDNVNAVFMLGTLGRAGTKTYQTYTRTNPETGEVYSGRTSGYGTPEQNIARRNANSPLNKQGFDVPYIDRTSTNPAAIRGREQQLIDRFGGAQSQSGTSANKINGISPANPNRQNYLDQTLKEFGKLLGP